MTETQKKLNEEIEDKSKAYNLANDAANAAKEMQGFADQAAKADVVIGRVADGLKDLSDPRLRKMALGDIANNRDAEARAGERERLQVVDQIAADRKRQRDPAARAEMRDQELERRKIEKRFEQAQEKAGKRGVKLSRQDQELLALMGGAGRAGGAGEQAAIAKQNVRDRQMEQANINVAKMQGDVEHLAADLARLLRAAN